MASLELESGGKTIKITSSNRSSTIGVEASSVILSGFLSLPILVLFPYTHMCSGEDVEVLVDVDVEVDVEVVVDVVVEVVVGVVVEVVVGVVVVVDVVVGVVVEVEVVVGVVVLVVVGVFVEVLVVVGVVVILGSLTKFTFYNFFESQKD